VKVREFNGKLEWRQMVCSREYPSRPICGVGVVVRKGHEVILVQRGQAPRRGEWGLPGGVVELGETLHESAQREVREECGIEISLGGVIDAVDVIHRDSAGNIQFHYVVVDLTATYLGGDLRPGGDVLDAHWVERRDLDAYVLPKRVHEVVSKAFGRVGEAE